MINILMSAIDIGNHTLITVRVYCSGNYRLPCQINKGDRLLLYGAGDDNGLALNLVALLETRSDGLSAVIESDDVVQTRESGTKERVTGMRQIRFLAGSADYTSVG
jgi:hypothetical protein